MNKLLPLIFLLFFSCKNTKSSDPELGKVYSKQPSSQITILSDSTFLKKYTYETATATYPLQLALKEISGLSFFPNKNQLLTINDERGVVYFLDATSGEIKETITFAGNGDYEGVELVGKKISVVKSNGDIYFYNLEKKKKGEKIKTPLQSSSDVEGLAVDSSGENLLIACKGNPNLKDSDKYKKTKNIYQFNLEKEKLNKSPWLTITDDELKDFV